MNLHERLQAGEIILGIANTYPAAGIIEIMCKGWDLVWIDGQHGQFEYNSMIAAVRAADAIGVAPLIRVPTHDPILLGTYADMNPAAIMLPMVDTVEQAKSIARALTFPPRGNRSYGGRRPTDLFGREYYQTQNPLVVAQIETLEAVENAEAIIAVDGIDMLFFGPDDMKLRMGIPIETSPLEHPELRAAMLRTAQIARAAGKFAGTVAGSPAAAAPMKEMGYQLLMGGADVAIIRTLAPQRLAEIKKALG